MKLDSHIVIGKSKLTIKMLALGIVVRVFMSKSDL